MNKKCRAKSNDSQHEQINQILHAPKIAKGLRHCCLILLLTDESEAAIPKQLEIAQCVGVSDVTVYHTVKNYVNDGLEATLSYRQSPRPGRPAALTEEQEARGIALAYSKPPEGYAR